MEELGTQIGSYKLLSVLSEGGFGIVYQAEQKEPVRRQVALRLIKPGMDSKQVIARFESERQALALLDHPNVARVFDGGTTESGRPYFVTELVKGLPITEYCDEQKLSIEERLELFRQVCEAVQHAHQKGIIHRDIKPSNILVSVQAGKPVPMIIDFGVAKAISQPLTERTLFTEQGQFIGTPEYISPEQAGTAVQDIDTRSDIYSLGVVLYELLTGALPFSRDELEQAGFAGIQRIIRDTEPPPPSTRLSSLGEGAKKVAEGRRTEVAALTRRLHEELEWIPLKAMRKEPDRRYKTASELADDVQNYLNQDLLIAGPESIVYRARKFARKHSSPLASAAAVAVVLFAGMVASVSMYFEAKQAQDYAEKMARQAEQAREEETAAHVEAEQALYFSRIDLAEKELATGNLYCVHRLLASCSDEVRGWEWYYLWGIYTSAGVVLPGGPSGDVRPVSFSPDAKYVVSGDGHSVILWDAQTGSKVRPFRGHSDISSVAFSPDGKQIALGGSGTVMLRDVATGSSIRTFRRQGGKAVRSVAFSPDGNRIATADGMCIRAWDLATEEEIFSVAQRGYAVFGPDGRHVVVTSRGNSDAPNAILLLDATTGSVVKTLTELPKRRSVAFSPDGCHVAVDDSYETKKIQYGIYRKGL